MKDLKPIGTEFTTVLRADERCDTDSRNWVTTWRVIEHVECLDEFYKPVQGERVEMVKREYSWENL